MAVCRSGSRARLEPRAAVLAVAALLWACHCASAANYTCGDDYGWQRPPATDPGLYSEWSAKYTFYPTDRIRFDSLGANTNVEQISATEYAACDTVDHGDYGGVSATPVTFTFVDVGPGDYYFTSNVPGDCQAGLKVKITISPSSCTGGGTPPAPAPSAATNDFYVGLDGPGAFGWSFQRNQPTFYQDWADGVAPLYTDTDVLVFDYAVASHDVVVLNATAYSTCDVSSPMAIFETGRDRVPATLPGVYYFSSDIIGDCSEGNMHFSIQYLAGSRPGGGTPNPPAPIGAPPLVPPPDPAVAPPLVPPPAPALVPPPVSRPLPPPPTSLLPPSARNPPPAGLTLPPGFKAPPSGSSPKNAATSGARAGCLLLLAALGFSLLLLS